MKTILACAMIAILLAGCQGIGDVAAKRAAEACEGYKETPKILTVDQVYGKAPVEKIQGPAYQDCYAQAYQNIYASASARNAAVSGAMLGASATMLSQPAVVAPPQSIQTTTCRSNPVTGQVTCTTF